MLHAVTNPSACTQMELTIMAHPVKDLPLEPYRCASA